MNVQGKVISCLPAQTGTGKNGEWVKSTYIIETGGQYPKKVAVTIWGSTLPVLKEGQEVDCHIDVESKEFNGKWYTEVKCFKVDFITNGTPKTEKPKAEAKNPAATKEEYFSSFEPADDSDNLPF